MATVHKVFANRKNNISIIYNSPPLTTRLYSLLNASSRPRWTVLIGDSLQTP